MRVVHTLLWTSERIEHVAHHGLTPEEVEEAVFDDPNRLVRRGEASIRTREERLYLLYGCTSAGKKLFVVLIDKGQGRAYPVTARPMTAQEARTYERRGK